MTKFTQVRLQLASQDIVTFYITLFGVHTTPVSRRVEYIRLLYTSNVNQHFVTNAVLNIHRTMNDIRCRGNAAA